MAELSPEINAVVVMLQAAWAKAGWLAVIPLSVMLSIRLWRWQRFADALPERLRFDSQSTWVKWAIPLVLGGGSTFLAAVETGTRGLMPLATAFAAGVIGGGGGSVAAHHLSRGAVVAFVDRMQARPKGWTYGPIIKFALGLIAGKQP